MADSRNSILFGTLANGGSPSNPPFGEIFVKGGFVPIIADQASRQVGHAPMNERRELGKRKGAVSGGLWVLSLRGLIVEVERRP